MFRFIACFLVLLSFAFAKQPELLFFDDLAALQTQFNEDRGKIRLFVLFSPTCHTCNAGADWLQNNYLANKPDADVVIYAVWFSILPKDAASEWDATLLTDERVVHFWDSDRLLSDHIIQNKEGISGIYSDVAHGLYLLYGPESVWEHELPSNLVDSATPLFAWTTQLGTHLSELTGN